MKRIIYKLILALAVSLSFVSCGNNETYEVGDIIMDNQDVVKQGHFSEYNGKGKPVAVCFDVEDYGKDGKYYFGMAIEQSPEMLPYRVEGSDSHFYDSLDSQIWVINQDYDEKRGCYVNDGFYGKTDHADRLKAHKEFNKKMKKAQKYTQDFPAYGYAGTYLKKYGKYDEWWIPSVIRLYTMYENKDIVNKSLKEVGGDLLGHEVIWSASQFYFNEAMQ